MEIEYVRGGRRRRVSKRDGEILIKLGKARSVEPVKSATYETRQMVPDTNYSRADLQPGDTQELRADPQPDDTQALRAEYKSLYGKQAFMGWNADKLRQKIAEAKQE